MSSGDRKLKALAIEPLQKRFADPEVDKTRVT